MGETGAVGVSDAAAALAIDLNADVGESFGAWVHGADDALLPLVSSANVACGFHAGDPGTMRRTVERAMLHGVAVGAHPGLPDLPGFGRRAMAITPDDAFDLVTYQTGALLGIAAAAGARVAHVKPHGALYNMAAGDVSLARAIAHAVVAVDRGLLLYMLAGSPGAAAARDAGARVVDEAFPERGYAGDGTLLPRTHPEATIHDPDVAARRAVKMARIGIPRVTDAAAAPQVGTLCIHGDAPNAVRVAQAVRAALEAAGITVRAPLGVPA